MIINIFHKLDKKNLKYFHVCRDIAALRSQRRCIMCLHKTHILSLLSFLFTNYIFVCAFLSVLYAFVEAVGQAVLQICVVAWFVDVVSSFSSLFEDSCQNFHIF